jgi:hypothetical protein
LRGAASMQQGRDCNLRIRSVAFCTS